MCIAPFGGQKFCLRLHRAEVAQGDVFAVAVVEDFDVVEDGGADLGLVGEDVVAHGGGFVAAKERFHGRVVAAVALGADAREHLQAGQHTLVAVRGIGASPVAVVPNASTDFAAGIPSGEIYVFLHVVRCAIHRHDGHTTQSATCSLSVFVRYENVSPRGRSSKPHHKRVLVKTWHM